MFLPNIEAGLSNIYKSLVDGGRFAAAVWSTPDKVPQLSIPMNIARRETNAPLPPPGTPGPFGLADKKLLHRAFENTGFRNIQIEKVKVTFKFDAAEDYTKFTQDIAAPVNAMLKDQSKDRTEQIWNMITKEVSSHTATNTTTKDDSVNQKIPISLDNESICIVGIK